MSKAVLDTSALLAVFHCETGHEIAASVIYGATVSTVNYSEVIKKFVERGGNVHMAQQLLDRQSLRLVTLDRQRAIHAAAILPHTQSRGLSFADRVCLATGKEFGLPVFTSDQRMTETTLDVVVTLIRPRPL
jgi:ribonuclease VapC